MRRRTRLDLLPAASLCDQRLSHFQECQSDWLQLAATRPARYEQKAESLEAAIIRWRTAEPPARTYLTCPDLLKRYVWVASTVGFSYTLQPHLVKAAVQRLTDNYYPLLTSRYWGHHQVREQARISCACQEGSRLGRLSPHLWYGPPLATFPDCVNTEAYDLAGSTAAERASGVTISHQVLLVPGSCLARLQQEVGTSEFGKDKGISPMSVHDILTALMWMAREKLTPATQADDHNDRARQHVEDGQHERQAQSL
ncbi:hypothetical protein WJX84_008969 [Apatococcus fuscideae]|uniref:Uncharacterized protein n=1 Tax=Apatococcus fuscideae TaxID=2026836 RepID=A0AAW1TAA0_9CHLO